ncbi:MAG: ATP synthase F0 subunit A, partial [Raoultibacter sp.]
MNALETLASEVPHLQHSFDPTFVFGSVTQYVLWMFIILIITFAVVLGTAKRLTLIPTNKFTNMVEYGYEFVKKDMGENAIGHGYKKHVP